MVLSVADLTSASQPCAASLSGMPIHNKNHILRPMYIVSTAFLPPSNDMTRGVSRIVGLSPRRENGPCQEGHIQACLP